MAGLDPAIPVSVQDIYLYGGAWMRGSSPRMTEKGMWEAKSAFFRSPLDRIDRRPALG